MIEIYLCGTPIISIVGNKPGTISAVEIRHSNVIYEFKYFNEGEFKTTWLHENEFTTQSNKIEVGYKNERKKI